MDVTFFVGVAFRILAVGLFLVIGFALLDFLRSAPVVGAILGSADADDPMLAFRLLIAIVLGLLPLLWLFLIIAMIAECQIVLLRGLGFTPAAAQVFLPVVFGAIGAYLGYAYFCQSALEPMSSAAERLFVLGSALLFYLAASFQLWNWDQWHRMTPSATPILWYAILICLVGGFLGSRIAFESPSPYILETIQYRQRVWGPSETPPADDLIPYEDPPSY